MKNNKKTHADIFTSIAIYAYYFYWAFMSLFRISNRGNTMSIFHISILFISLILFALSCLKRRRIQIIEATILLFLILNYVSYFANDLFFGTNPTALDTIKDFSAKSVPAVLLGIYIAKENKIDNLKKGLFPLSVFFTLFSMAILIPSLINGYSANQWDTLFLINYQNASYTGAFVVGIIIYKLFIEEKRLTTVVKIYYYFALLINSLLAIYSGGRGGVVVIVFYLLFLLFYEFFYKKKSVKLLYSLFGSVLLLVFALYIINVNSDLLSGLTRAFEFINKDGINWDGTSGRLSIYQEDLNLFLKSPIIGHGITGSPRFGIERTHNVIFDILIDGGLFYLCFWLVIWIGFAIYVFKKMKDNTAYALIFIIFIGDFLMLNFSLVYMRSTAMWFALAFYLTDKFNSRKVGRLFDEYSYANKRISATR